MASAPSRTDSPSPSPAERIVGSWFQLRECLSESNRIRTHQGRSIHDGHAVVIKIIPTDAVHPGSLMRLEYEASHLQRLQSPWLAPLVYVGRENSDLLLVYEHVSGVSLRACLAVRRLSIPESLAVGRGLFSAPAHMHEHRLLHRGVRPSNVIVDGAEQVTKATLVDFDPTPALRLDDAALRSQSLDAALYLSPEQAGAIDQDITEAADLYSAGVTLYHCLAGRPPFTGTALGTILFEHMTAEVPKLRSLGIAVPRALDELVQRLLRKDPRDRYQSASAVLADLESIAAAQQRGEPEPAVVIGAHDNRETLTEPAFVARASELRLLDEQLRSTKEGHGRLVLLEGESGGGKTRLLTETTHRAAAQGLWVLWGQGTNDVARQPFSLLRGVVEGFLSRAAADREFVESVRRRLGDQSAAVGAALPGLAEFFGDGDKFGSAPEQAGEVRTLRTLTSFLDVLGNAERPALIVLDDCQWADELTYRLIRRWQTSSDDRSGQRNTLLLIACRSEEVDREHPLRSISGATHMELSPFAAEEIGQLLESMAGPLPTVVVDAIIRLAEGSPFMASAVLRGFTESGALLRDTDGWKVDASKIGAVQSSSQAAMFLARRWNFCPPKQCGCFHAALCWAKNSN